MCIMVIMPKIELTNFEVLILQLLASTFFQHASYKLTPAVQTLPSGAHSRKSCYVTS